ncbi:MAG: hypothetical protein IT384_01455, partial [Deltaproteobacteria bacterium]|nr:hypothetical protein [Deltaproteobacteria bacterium]
MNRPLAARRENGECTMRAQMGGSRSTVLVIASVASLVSACSDESTKQPSSISPLIAEQRAALVPSICTAGSNLIVGTAAGETIIGTAGPDCIFGLGGNDELRGRGGDDVLIGGDGDDTILGGDGNDLVNGGAGVDVIYGGNGADELWGGSGDDTLLGGGSGDTLYGGSGGDTLFGGGGTDTLYGGSGDDYFEGDSGADAVYGGTGDDVAFGEGDDDHIEGCFGADYLIGSGGSDTIHGGAEDDFLAGGSGRDTLLGGSGNDIIDGDRRDVRQQDGGNESCDDNDGDDGPGIGVCGDGVLDADEACDDGNASSCDGCSSTCTVEPNCDDGNPCTVDSCDASSCLHLPAPDGPFPGSVPTSCGVGACATTGQTVCSNGAVVDSCTPGTPAANDPLCDGVDDDCDGATDEDYLASTSCFLPGVCASGNVASSCTGGIETACQTGSPSGISEVVCNGADDDCDGASDEDYVASTGCFLPGVCAAGNQASSCVGGVESTCQTGSPSGVSESVCNG